MGADRIWVVYFGGPWSYERRMIPKDWHTITAQDARVFGDSVHASECVYREKDFIIDGIVRRIMVADGESIDEREARVLVEKVLSYGIHT